MAPRQMPARPSVNRSKPSTGATAARRAGAKKRTGQRSLFPFVVGGVVLIGVVFLAAVVMGRSSEPTVAQVRDVTIEGEALPAVPADGGVDPAIGKQIPVVRGENFEGSPTAIAPTGQPQILTFVAHWCENCRAEVPQLVEWLNSPERPENLSMVVVPTGTDPRRPNYPPSDWLATEGMLTSEGVSVLVDNATSATGEAFGIRAYPYFVFVNPDGTVALRLTGRQSPATFADLAQRFAAGEDVAGDN